uniref:Elongation of fatty acids protein n=1 Tax=Odontella aurita TaxID=265563 RepID=A0A6U6D1J1_9STRA|mmetsp:Transcript_17398/g.50627  ORF Transcript_17398/g.50627 Transcript_17398/m.50627 type:complete len:292 (+) Transcript_17398:791-1666(+)
MEFAAERLQHMRIHEGLPSSGAQLEGVRDEGLPVQRSGEYVRERSDGIVGPVVRPEQVPVSFVARFLKYALLSCFFLSITSSRGHVSRAQTRVVLIALPHDRSMTPLSAPNARSIAPRSFFASRAPSSGRELLDTFFIVIHKKPLILLHWYHHFTVLLYCWHSYVHKAPAGIFFVTMNYAVHGIMYGYYFLMAVKAKPRWMNAKFITIAQISQMVVGVGVTMASFYYYMKEEENDGGDDDPCLIRKENNVAAFVMYGSYLFLFLQFFVGRYLKGKARKSIESKVEANKKAD